VSRSDEIRSHPQNKRLHAMIRDISEQVKWAGEYMDERRGSSCYSAPPTVSAWCRTRWTRKAVSSWSTFDARAVWSFPKWPT
jgi:hypothetical protein